MASFRETALKRRQCLAACMAWAGVGRGQDLPTLTIGFDEGSPPTMYRAAPRLQAHGIYPALVGAAFALMGRPCELHALPFKRMLGGADADQLLAGAVVRTPDRERRWLFSQPYFMERLAVYTAGPPFRSLADLTGKRVGVIRGWSYGEAFDMARQQGLFLCEEVPTDANNFGKLLRERLDFAVVTELAGRMLLQLPGFEGHVVAGAAPLGVTPIHLALRQGHSGGAALLGAFNAAVDQLYRDGQVEPLVAREIAAAAQVVKAQPVH